MAAVADYLADTSALARLDRASVAQTLGPLIEAGLVATCSIVELEVRFSARSPNEFEQVVRDRTLAYEMLPMDDWIATRALYVQASLAASGQLRAVKLPDLLIAATAERHDVELLHYDHDFDRIATITRQPAKWVARPGTVP
jgi:predicted nucleic acid-binding protein